MEQSEARFPGQPCTVLVRNWVGGHFFLPLVRARGHVMGTTLRDVPLRVVDDFVPGEPRRAFPLGGMCHW